jgi:WD40 repeat protein
LWNAGKTADSLGPQIRAGTDKKRELGTDAAGKKSAATTEKLKGEYSGAQFNAVAFSPDGSKVLTGSDDNTARLWSAADGSPIGQPLKHEGSVFAVAFSPDGSKVMTSTNLWLHIFQLRSEAVLAIANWLKPSRSFTAPFVEPSGRIVTGVADGKLAIVRFEADLPTAEAITGRSEALSRDWQRRLALQFTADGKIVPAPQ